MLRRMVRRLPVPLQQALFECVHGLALLAGMASDDIEELKRLVAAGRDLATDAPAAVHCCTW